MSVISKPVEAPILDALDRSRDIICLLDEGLRFTYCNPAWDEFALANGGTAALGAHVNGLLLFNVIPAVLADFYKGKFDEASWSGQVVEIDYECSSAELFRLFRMRIMPLKGSKGFQVVHSLRLERPHAAGILSQQAAYCADNGLITMCSHCRHVRCVDDPERWDWVAEYVRSMPRNVTHGICRSCHSYFYPKYYGKSARI
jgi:PAS domain-containing protein